MFDRADAAYFLARTVLALLTAAAARATFRYGRTLPAGGRRRSMAYGGAFLLSIVVGLSAFDAIHNGLLTPGQPIPVVSWLWLFGFDLLVPLWAFMLVQAQRERDEAEAELERLAVTDQLTGALNRRGFLDQAHAAIARARRGTEPVVVAMLDLDRFKSINDGFGHDAGDAVLRGFSSALADGLRAGDLLGRFGGEEFIILLFGIAAADAAATIDRLRGQVRTRVPHPAGPPAAVTVSVGIAELAHGRDPQAALKTALTRADSALYEAKATGRDKIVMAPPDWA